MNDEELEKLCNEALEKIMEDDRYFVHLLIQASKIRAERLYNKYNQNY